MSREILTSFALREIIILILRKDYDEAKLKVAELVIDEEISEKELLPMLSYQLQNFYNGSGLYPGDVAAALDEMGYKSARGKKLDWSKVIYLKFKVLNKHGIFRENTFRDEITDNDLV